LASDDVLARAFAVVESTYWLATGVGAVLAAPLVAALGIRGALIGAGAAVALALTARWAALSHFETHAPVDDRDFGLTAKACQHGGWNPVRPCRAWPVPLATVETLTQRVQIVTGPRPGGPPRG
jgi:hypothetical protein